MNETSHKHGEGDQTRDNNVRLSEERDHHARDDMSIKSKKSNEVAVNHSHAEQTNESIGLSPDTTCKA
jgi:hypothetical protein